MATYTENYDLIKPDETDTYNINTFNENMDMIDSTMAAAESAMESVGKKVDTVSANTNNIDQKIGTSSTGKTLFSLLENSTSSGFTKINSFQHIVKTLPANSTSCSVELKHSVIPEKCIVLFERLSGGSYKLVYTLNATNMDLSFAHSGTYEIIYGFWVIELM